MPKISDIEETPNPNAVKFILKEPVSNGTAHQFASKDSAQVDPLAKSLFEADLIDEIGFNIHPVLLGSGIPLFYEMNRQINLELIECKQFKNGCLMASYRVKHPGDKGTTKTTARKRKTKGGSA